jgi:peptidyl-prolyl cis-trans isomerase A (cyclophilin A)
MKTDRNRAVCLAVSMGIAAALLLAGCGGGERRAEEPAAEERADAARDPGLRTREAPPAVGNNVYQVRFETTAGDFTVEVHRDWAPIGAERFEELVKTGFYDGASFFRVVPNFVVQFGIPGNPSLTRKWRNSDIQDDPVKQSNSMGTIVFATAGPNTRTTQVFINLVDNQRLDAQGFAPFGQIIQGMGVVSRINSEYRERPDQKLLETRGDAYIKENFPKIDYIKKATIL